MSPARARLSALTPSAALACPRCRRVRGLVAAILCALLLAGARPARAESSPCQHGISPATAKKLFDAVNHPPAEPDCKLDGVGTERETLEVRWSRAGAPLPPIRIVPRECAPEGATASGPFVIEVPREIGQSCPSVLPLIEALVAKADLATPGSDAGDESDPLYRITRALFAAIIVLGLGLLAQAATRLRREDASWLLLGIAGFGAALAVRALLPFSIGNWYSEVLPAAGPPPWMRFGPGLFAFQSLFRDLGLWGPRTLELSQIVAGAAAIPLTVAVLRELRVGLAAAAATIVLLIFSPFHARLSATASEHVLASTLWVALLYCGLRAVRSGERLWLLLAALLIPAVGATRIDMAAQACLVLPWLLLRDRVERQAASGRRALRTTALLAIVAAATMALGYRFIAMPSNHPMPELFGQLLALRYSLAQFWILSTSAPGWVTLSSVVLAGPGVVWMLSRRPLLLVRVATVLLSFVLLGRTFLHDELVGARYFLFTLPILFIVPGEGFEALLALIPAPARTAAAVIGLSILSVVTAFEARTAYGVRYAFQDEYSFARRALAKLPAGCVVYEVPIRDGSLPRDIDCCLDVARSPLVLDFPDLRFLNLPHPETVDFLWRDLRAVSGGAVVAGLVPARGGDSGPPRGRALRLSTVSPPSSVFGAPSCVAYYESIACAITATPGDPAVALAEDANAYFGPRCRAVRATGQLEPLAESTTSPLATENLFGGGPPRVALFRWTDGQEAPRPAP